MQDDNMGHLAANEKAMKVPIKPLSSISEAGASSRVLTSNRPQSLTLARVDQVSRSKWPPLRLQSLRARPRCRSRGPTGRSEGSWLDLKVI